MLDGRLGRSQVDLGEFVVELADLVLSPDGGAELVMGDRREHEEPRVFGVQSVI